MMNDPLDLLMEHPLWAAAYAIQRDTLEAFHARCARVLGPACALEPLGPPRLAMERNLFSTLFITASLALPLDEDKARRYALVNQCMRALVTGCDNLLDDEYKVAVPFALRGGGTRFRSVLHIMVADRVLAELAMEQLAAGRISLDQAYALPRTALAVLLPSGIQEHEEESGNGRRVPSPQAMLDSVHHRKTGLLFQAPLHLIQRMGDAPPAAVAPLVEALRHLGLACQALDDLKDVASDLARSRHNLVLSLAYHEGPAAERERVAPWLQKRTGGLDAPEEVAEDLPVSSQRCLELADELFDKAKGGFVEAIHDWREEHADALASVIRMAVLMSHGRPPVGLAVEEALV